MRACGGDLDAFHGLAADALGGLYWAALRVLGTPAGAELAVCETLSQAWEGMAGREPATPFGRWLARVLAGVLATRVPADDPADRPRPETDEDGRPVTHEARWERLDEAAATVQEAVACLCGPQRLALVLADGASLTCAEIAGATGRTESGVRRSLHAARLAVRAAIDSGG